MDGVLQGAGLVGFAVAATWGLSLLVGRGVARHGLVGRVWKRASVVGAVLTFGGFGLALIGLTQVGTPLGSTLLLVGSLLSFVGLWLLVPLL
jgi:hypothetical protein